MKSLDLGGRWEFKAIDAYRTLPGTHKDVTTWMNGRVPGSVHTDLLANKKIPDPFYRMCENDVQWIESLQWIYRRQFNLTEDFLAGTIVELVAGGLDTYAQVHCNGSRVGDAADMFIEYRWDVTKYHRKGVNAIEILFDSPTVRAKAIEQKHGTLNVALEPHRVYVRKAQYSFGWDWGPKLTTSGIWRPMRLEAYSHARLRNSFVKVQSVDAYEAVVECTVDTETHTNHPLTLQAHFHGGGWSADHTIPIRDSQERFTMHIPQPQLWWPNGYGGQPLYAVSFSLLCDGAEIQTTVVRFALRRVRLLQEKDDAGTSFVMEVNGAKIFCKGADWIPCDSFLPRVTAATYEKLLGMAQEAHMNMIRVWGGGIYEQDVFYDLCDRLGLMVWQDFMFACGEYPEEDWFLGQVREEAEQVVKRLCNHPSIVLWCGNNECEWLFCMQDRKRNPDDMRGAKIFRDVLPGVCRQYDGTRPYWRSSPFGDGYPNDESNGNHHQWIVWSSWKDFKEYENTLARFVTEFGFQAPANRKTMEKVTLVSDRRPQSKVMEHHNKQVEGTERLFRFQAAHYRLTGEFDDFIYKGQLVQAEALKCAAEHWRRRKFKTAGVLFWQLNDCWPVSSWAVVDSALRPKAAYFYAKRFYAPVLVSFQRTDGGIAVWLTNDLPAKMTGKLRISLRSFRGRIVWKKEQDVDIDPNESMQADYIEQSLWNGSDGAGHYLFVESSKNGAVVAENRYFFEEPKHLQLPRVKLTKTLRRDKDSLYRLILHSNTFVKNLRIDLEGTDVILNDNDFDLDPRRSKEVRFRSDLRTSEVKRRLKFRWL